jgi:maltooligosyltrehalose trehalohydrolase
VYNHLGPEGNYLSRFGPYFTNRYCTPWGDALNFDGEWSDGVRDFFSTNALYWMKHYHIDGLRCDAIHTVYDHGAVHFWELTSARVKALSEELGRPLHLIAESDLNSPRVVKAAEDGGLGFDAQWLDDFHHALYVMLDEKGRDRYYDFGTMEQLAKAYTDGFVHSGEWVKFRKRKHGASSAGVPGSRFIVFNQNHDQVGNRVGGERLCMLVDFERTKIGAAAVLLSPYIPMLFMGEEYADETPFYYFVSHSDQGLIEAVRQGRKNEFKDFGFDVSPPDPQAEKTFSDSKLNWKMRDKGKHQVMWRWHQQLLRLRNEIPALKNVNKNDVQVQVLGTKGFALLRRSAEDEEHVLALFNLSDQELSCTIPAWMHEGVKVLDSKDEAWQEDPSAAAQAALPVQVRGGKELNLPPLSVAVFRGR